MTLSVEAFDQRKSPRHLVISPTPRLMPLYEWCVIRPQFAAHRSNPSVDSCNGQSYWWRLRPYEER
jgi:hypothetical protein